MRFIIDRVQRFCPLTEYTITVNVSAAGPPRIHLYGNHLQTSANPIYTLTWIVFLQPVYSSYYLEDGRDGTGAGTGTGAGKLRAYL